jgi:hypothetical protein
LIGYNESGTVSNTYAAGSVSGTSSSGVGGLIGSSLSGTISNSYWDTQVSERSSSSGGTGKTTIEMKQQATFVDWDFNDVWVINETVTYPRLRTLVISGDANLNGTVNVSDLSLLAANYGMTSGATWAMGDFTGEGAVNVSDLSLLAANYGTGDSSTVSWADAYAHAFGTTDGLDVETETASDDSDSEASTDVVSSSACNTLGLSLIAVLFLMGLMMVKPE